MGCGACGMGDVSPASGGLQYRLLQRIRHLQQKRLIREGGFVSVAEVKAIENVKEALTDTIPVGGTHRLQAGERGLLTEERRVAWKLALMTEDNSNKVFDGLTLNGQADPKSQATEKRLYEIALDVKRTFPECQHLDREQLSAVLQSTTGFFEGVGYTQGMNFVVGFLLLCGFSPLEAHQLFVRLSYHPRFLLIRNFSDDFKNANACIKIMEHVIEESSSAKLRGVKARIEEMGMNFFLFVFSWFLTYFLYNFALSGCVLVWDYLILAPVVEPHPEHPQKGQFGSGFVNSVNLALRIIEAVADDILACEELNEVMHILRHDNIAERIDEHLIEQLILRSRNEPMLTWSRFAALTQQHDPELYGILTSLQPQPQPLPKQKDEKNGPGSDFQSFMRQCRFPRRPSPSPA